MSIDVEIEEHLDAIWDIVTDGRHEYDYRTPDECPCEVIRINLDFFTMWKHEDCKDLVAAQRGHRR